mmetsp:Transcript_77663/g.231429  ORF Transcript_77663/g.231429 Transcript_77663/m.231429 type:complete len:236 (-) Transcript_77663:86-793(-)
MWEICHHGGRVGVLARQAAASIVVLCVDPQAGDAAASGAGERRIRHRRRAEGDQAPHEQGAPPAARGPPRRSDHRPQAPLDKPRAGILQVAPAVVPEAEVRALGDARASPLAGLRVALRRAPLAGHVKRLVLGTAAEKTVAHVMGLGSGAKPLLYQVDQRRGRSAASQRMRGREWHQQQQPHRRGHAEDDGRGNETPTNPALPRPYWPHLQTATRQPCAHACFWRGTLVLVARRH